MEKELLQAILKIQSSIDDMKIEMQDVKVIKIEKKINNKVIN